jgi:hypothetical protein
MKQKLRSRLNPKKPKTILRLPDLEHAKAAVLNSLISADARRGYPYKVRVLDGLLWYLGKTRTTSRLPAWSRSKEALATMKSPASPD